MNPVQMTCLGFLVVGEEEVWYGLGLEESKVESKVAE